MKNKQSKRYPLLDVIRGITMISMILYHGMWDLVYIRGVQVPWYGARPGYLWQQSICWTFIFLSGFCIIFSKRLLKRGLTVFGAGLVVTLVTVAVMYEDRVVFGVLTLIGSCMLLMIPVRRCLSEKLPHYTMRDTLHPAGNCQPEDTPRSVKGSQPEDTPRSVRGSQPEDTTRSARGSQPEDIAQSDSGRLLQDDRKANDAGVTGMAACLAVSFALFVLTKDINGGRIGISMLHRICAGIPDLYFSLPTALYSNYLTAYIGFPPADFYSTDYFSILPWFFLYLSGYFTGLIAEMKGWLESGMFQLDIVPISWIGRHSLLIYMLHQPILYLLIMYIL